jgi:hypothetical protein
VALGGADGAIRAGANTALAHLGQANGSIAQSAVPTEASASVTELIWTIDVDADGIADFSNPTHGGVRAGSTPLARVILAPSATPAKGAITASTMSQNRALKCLRL